MPTDSWTLWEAECDRAFTDVGRALKSRLEGDHSRSNIFAHYALQQREKEREQALREAEWRVNVARLLAAAIELVLAAAS